MSFGLLDYFDKTLVWIEVWFGAKVKLTLLNSEKNDECICLTNMCFFSVRTKKSIKSALIVTCSAIYR